MPNLIRVLWLAWYGMYIDGSLFRSVFSLVKVFFMLPKLQ